MDYYLFNPEFSEPLCYIHPLKVRKIDFLLHQKIPDFVLAIYLFGSSINLLCQTASDIDIYFIVKNGEFCEEYVDILHKLCRKTGDNFDLLIGSLEEFKRNSVSINSVEHKILEGGLCLWCKGK